MCRWSLLLRFRLTLWTVCSDIVALLMVSRPAAEAIADGARKIGFGRQLRLGRGEPCNSASNAHIESLNGKFRAECLNTHWFTSIEEMRRICGDWRSDYNEVRPHSALGNKPPMALMNCSGQHGPS